MYIGQSR